MLLMLGGGCCGGEWRNGDLVLGMSMRKWVAVGVGVRAGCVGRFEVRRLVRLFGEGWAVAVVMGLLGGSFLR